MADQALRQRSDVLRVEAQAAMAALVAFNQQQAGAGQAGIPLPQGPPLHPPLPPGTPPAAAGPPQAAAAHPAAVPLQVAAPPPSPPVGPGAGVQPQMVRGVGMLRQQRPLVHRAAAPAAAAAVAVGNQFPPWQFPKQQQPGPRMQGPIPAAQGAPGPVHSPYQYIAPHLMAQGAQQQQPQQQRQQPQQQQQLQQQQLPQQHQFIQPQMYGPAADNAGYPPMGAFGFPQMAQVLGGFLGGGLGPWGQQQEGTRKP
jgi:hypothetical protein